MLYNFLLYVGFTLALPYFLFIAWRDGKYLANFRQRLGELSPFERPANSKIVWLHCVSVGETNAAKPLAEAFLKNFPEYRLVVSTTTLTGQKLAREIFGKTASYIFYFPFDFRFAVRRALRHIQPDLILIMETEIWLNFLREAKKNGAKTAIINGRLSEKSFRNYRFIKLILQKGLKNLDLALMQTEADAQRLQKLGMNAAKITVTGNIKFDIAEFENRELTEYFRRRFDISGARPLLIAASTHSPEEDWILQSFRRVYEQSANEKKPRLIIVPRHPERFESVAELCAATDWRFARRSSNEAATDADADIILLDSIGELRAVYPLAVAVFVGGSAIPHGGQNILEPAAANVPVVSGFYTMNFAAILNAFRAANAVIQFEKLEKDEFIARLAETWLKLVAERESRVELAANAQKVLNKNRGATAETLQKLKSFIQ